MYRQSSSRNQRNKGFRMKHALQIFLLVAVCFWLIFQVKHSYDKKKDFDDNDARNSQHIQTNNEILKLGRKDPHPQVKEPSKKYEKQNEEADEDIEVDIKAEEKEDEVKGGGDDEVDEHDQQKSDSELDREKVIIDEEKELEGVNGKENGEKIVTDEDNKIETESSEDNLDHDEGTKNSHQAREEQYKADDASSAVTNEGHTFSSESESGYTQNQTNTLGNENKGSNSIKSIIAQNITDSKVQEEETARNGTSSMVNPEKGSDVSNFASKGSIFDNSTVTTESTDKLTLSNDTAEVGTELRDLLNGTEINILDLSHAQNDTDESKGSAAGSNIQTDSVEHANNFSMAMISSQFDNTTNTISSGYVESNLDASSNFSNDQIALEHTAASNASVETKEASEINVIEENRDAHQKSDLSTGADGNSGTVDSSNTENASKIQNGMFDSVVMEGKSPRLDLETLPNLRMGASKSEVAADE